MKKVLWITSEFPPRVNVASIRSVKFLKFLPESNWEAVVICPSEMMADSKASDSLLGQLGASITISRTSRNPLYYLLERGQVDRKATYLAYFLNNIVPPDGHIFWAILALAAIKRAIRKHKPDLVYVTCSPFSLNFIGAWVKQKYKLPWVADFRDLWTLNSIPRRFLNTYCSVVSAYLERFYLKRCDALIVNTENSRNRMVEKYPGLKNKIWVIPNGYDPNDIQLNGEIRVIPHSLFYGGSIQQENGYGPLPMLELLSKLGIETQQDSPWELHYAGREAEKFVDFAKRVGVPFECRTHGYLEQKEYYQVIQSMELVFLCMPPVVNSNSWIPARVYDFIGNNSRIICLAHRDSEISRLLQQYGNSLILLYDEPEETRVKKLRQYLLQPHDSYQLSEGFSRSLSRESLTRKLTQVFDRVTQ